MIRWWLGSCCARRKRGLWWKKRRRDWQWSFLLSTRRWVNGGVYVVVIHGCAEVVATKNMVERDKRERELSVKRKGKLGSEVGFLSTLHSILFMLRAWNPILFIADGRGTFYL